MKIRTTVLLALLTFSFQTFTQAATYKLDKDHTTVGFKIKHLFSWVNGTFDDYTGSFNYDPEKPETWSAEAVIKTASINTRTEARDKHLINPDFFDAEKYPEITFKSTSVTDVTPQSAKLNGVLSMHGVEKPIVLDLQIHGVVKDPWGNVTAGFTATAKINRKDFGLTWNQAVETGQLLVGEEVEITIEVAGLLAEEAPESAPTADAGQ